MKWQSHLWSVERFNGPEILNFCCAQVERDKLDEKQRKADISLFIFILKHFIGMRQV